MTEYTVEIKLPAHKRGDKWAGIPTIGPVLINNEQPAANLARIRMHFRHKSGTTFRLDSDGGQAPDAPVVINNASTWAAQIPPVAEFLAKPGSWSWDMEFYATGDTSPLTLYKGTLVVEDDVTK
jgi:hypothetical protein